MTRIVFTICRVTIVLITGLAMAGKISASVSKPASSSVLDYDTVMIAVEALLISGICVWPRHLLSRIGVSVYGVGVIAVQSLSIWTHSEGSCGCMGTIVDGRAAELFAASGLTFAIWGYLANVDPEPLDYSGKRK